MRILRNDPYATVVRDIPGPAWGLGGALACAGLVLLAFGIDNLLDGRPWSFVPQLIGAFLTLGFGGALLVMSPITTCIIDRQERTITIVRGGLRPKQVTHRRLRDVRDIYIREEPGNDGDTFIRAFVTFKGGEEMPLEIVGRLDATRGRLVDAVRALRAAAELPPPDEPAALRNG